MVSKSPFASGAVKLIRKPDALPHDGAQVAWDVVERMVLTRLETASLDASVLGCSGRPAAWKVFRSSRSNFSA